MGDNENELSRSRTEVMSSAFAVHLRAVADSIELLRNEVYVSRIFRGRKHRQIGQLPVRHRVSSE